jgi:hypothetical protein
MLPQFNENGYQSTKSKLQNMQARLAGLEARTDLDDDHKAMIINSYREMIAEYKRDLKLYEVSINTQKTGVS